LPHHRHLEEVLIMKIRENTPEWGLCACHSVG
jgi:hypothetical protein